MIRRLVMPTSNIAMGTIAVGVALALSSLGIVRAERMIPGAARTFKCSSGAACLRAISTGSTTYGISASSTNDHAVVGTTTSTSGNAGVVGLSTLASGSGYGVIGSSANGSGVVGSTTTSNGQYAGVSGYSNSLSGTGYGVAGSSANGAGVYGKTTSGSGHYTNAGVFGVSSNAPGVSAESDTSGFALYVQSDNTEGEIFGAYDPTNNAWCYILGNGDLFCSGSINGGAVRSRHHNSKGQRVLAYASESATATIDDVGTARMLDGVANVAISPDFAAVMDRNETYYVFLTPLGDTHGLYVSSKTASAFQVHETAGGRSSLAFDYRIVAHPIDAKNDRLPLAPRSMMPPSHQPRR